MEENKFMEIKATFEKGTLEQKIDIYIGTSGLSHEQYKELLVIFPIDELGKLEAALV